MLKLLLLVTFTITIVSSSFAAPPSPGRIVGGHDVNITKHPHQISLRRKNCPQCPYKHICGGSIYRENIIITAAHCVYEDKPENFVILAGTTLNNGTDGVTIPLKQIVVKDDYAPLSYDNDVALLFLEQPLPLNDVTIRPIPLASQVPQTGEIATVTGWGRTKADGKGTLILQEVELPIVDHKACNKAYTAVDTAMTIMDSMICAGLIGVGGKDSCQGDSGGPLVVNGELAGIVSWGMSCAEPQFPGVYSNVFHYRNWIEKINN